MKFPTIRLKKEFNSEDDIHVPPGMEIYGSKQALEQARKYNLAILLILKTES